VPVHHKTITADEKKITDSTQDLSPLQAGHDARKVRMIDNEERNAMYYSRVEIKRV
jgi:hypothetical protein